MSKRININLVLILEVAAGVECKLLLLGFFLSSCTGLAPPYLDCCFSPDISIPTKGGESKQCNFYHYFVWLVRKL